MDIVINQSYRVVRTETNPPDYWWEKHKFPEAKDFYCKIQELNDEGAKEIILPLDKLLQIRDMAVQTRDELQIEWHNPMTDCCQQRRPREECELGFRFERWQVVCKPGYGCKAKEEVKQ
jgi:hypothetical protein